MGDTCAVYAPSPPAYTFKVDRSKIRQEPLCAKDTICLAPASGITLKELIFYIVMGMCGLLLAAGIIFALIVSR